MNKILLACVGLSMLSFALNAQESSWNIDPSHSKIGFDISYFQVGSIKGVFDEYSGFATLKDSIVSSINISLKTASINTNQAERDRHLRSTDFFSAEEHPEITFKSTSITKSANNSYKITGDFTMTGITKSITLSAKDKGDYVHPRFKTKHKFISITGIINREDFKVGIQYPPAKMALGNDVRLTAEVQITENE